MRDHRTVFSCFMALCLTTAACSREVPVAVADAPIEVVIDHARIPDRYSAALPATAQGVKVWGDRDPALPPVGHVVDLLLLGDPGMLAALERSAADVAPDQAGEWVGAWRNVTEFHVGSPAFCAAVRPLMGGKATPLRDVLAGPFAASCREPADVAQALRPDMPYWAVIEAYNTELTGYPAPKDRQPLELAAQRALDADDNGQLWRALWRLAGRPEPEAWATLRTLHARVTDRERADQLAMAFFHTGDPELHRIAERTCASMQRAHTMCENGADSNEHDVEPEMPPADPASDIASTQKKLVELGFSQVKGTALQDFRSADATAMLTIAGHVHGFDAETGQFPNEHESVLRALAPLVRPALDGAVFEEVFPVDDEGPYELVAYLDGKRYRTSARNLGDWYDVDAVLRLLNAMLTDRGRVERYASLHTGNQVAWVVGGPKSAIEDAFKAGLLQAGDAGSAEESGKAFEEAVIRELTK